MKTTPVCFIFAGLIAASPLLLAQQAGDEGHARGADRWQKVDKDGDGAISRHEFADMPRLDKLPEDKRQALFDRLDKNGDGGISRVEMLMGRPSPDQQVQGPPRLGELDKNSDGVVSFEEFQNGRLFQRLDPEKQARIFKRLDSNGDGKITPEDKPPRRPRPEGGERPKPPRGDEPQPDKPRPRGLIEHLDKDGDGSVSLEEFRANPRMSRLDEESSLKRYRMLDRNGDGKVDRADIPRRDQARPRPGGPDQGPKGGAKIE